jgi:Kef-type K+ transport system membrane component KefB
MSLDVLNLLLVLIAALVGGRIAARLGYPAILGELGAGIILGQQRGGAAGLDAPNSDEFPGTIRGD